MDQVKVVLAALKKHHFWVLCGVIAVLVLAVWWSATLGLARAIEQRRGELEGALQKLQSVRSEELHPNDQIISAIKGKHKLVQDEVFKAWSFFHQRQKEMNRWPPLDREFPIYMDMADPDDEIPDRYRETYKYFIQNHIPYLYQIVDIRLPAERDEKTGEIKRDAEGNPIKIDPFEKSRGGNFGGSGDYGSGGMPGEMGLGYAAMSTSAEGDEVGVVDWNSSNLKQIWSDYYWTSTPTTLQVRLAQEDLWVYEALLRIIANTNGPAARHHNAAVKRIESLEIGRRAAPAFAQSRGQSLRPGGTMGFPSGVMGGAGMGGDEYMDYMEEASGGMGGDMGSARMRAAGGTGASEYAPEMEGGMEGAPEMGAVAGTGTSAATPEDQLKMRLLDSRYVDEDGVPLAASDPQPFAEFKMMPVRMVLLMDQRRISRLLVNCANSPMPVEVCLVSLNPGKGGSLNLGRTSGGAGYQSPYGETEAGMGSMFGTGTSPYSGMSDEGMYEGGEMAPGFSMGGGTTSGRQSPQTTYDILVEVQGIIYIFNPPDREKLGTGAAGEEAPTAPAGEPTMPAAPASGARTTPAPAAPATPPATGPTTPAAPAAGTGNP